MKPLKVLKKVAADQEEYKRSVRRLEELLQLAKLLEDEELVPSKSMQDEIEKLQTQTAAPPFRPR